MRKSLFYALSVICAMALFAISGYAASGDDQPIIDTTPKFIASQWVHFYGVTLGSEWQGFPAVLMPDYVQTGPNDRLDVTMPVYIDWEMHVPITAFQCNPASPTSVYPPRPLANESWYSGLYDQIVVGDIIQDVTSDTLYHSCAQGDGLEIPQVNPFPQIAGFTADGKLRVKDIHGGIGESMVMWVFTTVGDIFNPTEAYVLVLRWNKVATYTDVVTGLPVNALPGTAVRRPFDFIVGSRRCHYTMWATTIAVEWSSSDIAHTSPRFTDSADLAHLATAIGDPVTWSFDVSPNVPGPRNYECNIAPYGSSSLFVDSSDLSVMAADIGKNHCGLSKTGTGDETAAILKWFGIAATGRDVVVGLNGETVPEYAIVDPAKCQRAIADPYGYRSNLTGSPVQKAPWSKIKELYR